MRYIKRGVKPLFAHFKPQYSYCTILWLEEREHANDKVVEWRVAFLLRREQTLDKERDIRDNRSDTCVLNSGPTQTQPIKGVL